MEIKLVNHSNFNENSLNDFDRFQVVRNCYRLIDGNLVLVYHPFTETWDADRKKEKAREILSGEFITYCAFDEDRVVGEIMLVPELDHGRLIIDSFHVSGDCRRRGIGRALFDVAIEEGRRRSASSLYVSSMSAEETINFYKAMGCHVSRHPIKSYADDEPFDIQMELPLKEKPFRIETKRLFLREMTPDDYDALYKVFADPDIMQHYPYTFDEKRVRNWINRNMERYRILGFGLWVICLKDTGEMIGDCGLTIQDIDGFFRPEIGYHLRADQQRKGYAKEAACAVRDWAFENTTFGVIYSYMKYTNVPSQKTALAYGAHKVGEYPDPDNEISYVFALEKDEWKALATRN